MMPAVVSANIFEFLEEDSSILVNGKLEIGAIDVNNHRQNHYPLTGDLVMSSFHPFGWEFDSIAANGGTFYADWFVRDYARGTLIRWPGWPSLAGLPAWSEWNWGSSVNGPGYRMNWDGIQRDPTDFFATDWGIIAGYFQGTDTYGWVSHWYTRIAVWGMGAGPVWGPFANGQYRCSHSTEWGIYGGPWWGPVPTYIDPVGFWCTQYHDYEVMAGIHANITLKPETLNLGSEGTWIKATVEFPSDAVDTVDNIDVTTVKINNAVAAEANMKYGFVKTFEMGDFDGNGDMEVMIKFDRDGVCALIGTAQDIELRVSGRTTNNISFYGEDTIRAIKYYDHPK
jgi:hypothetical protein